MKKILFSIHYGDSIAHILRIRKIARDLILDGNKVLVCVQRKAKSNLINYVGEKNIAFVDQNYSYAKIPYTEDYKLNFIRHAISEYRIYLKFRPDIIIGDTGFITNSYNPKVPFIKILNRFYVELGSEFSSPFSRNEKEIIKRQAEELINSARNEIGIKEEFKYNDFITPPVLINGASYFVDDIFKKKRDGFNFIGINMSLNSNPIQNYDFSKCLVVLGTGFSQYKIKLVSDLLRVIEDKFQKIYISFGEKINKSDIYNPKNCILKRRFDSIPDNVGLLICHGGLGTIHLGIQMRVPIIALPFQIEQFSNAYRIEKLGWGINIGKVDNNEFRGLRQEIDVDWDLLEYSIRKPELIIKSKYKVDHFKDQIENDSLLNIRRIISRI